MVLSTCCPTFDTLMTSLFFIATVFVINTPISSFLCENQMDNFVSKMNIGIIDILVPLIRTIRVGIYANYKSNV